jgi:putative glutamine amidotransferase
MASASGSAPRIVVTVADPATAADPDLAARRNALYVAALGRHGAASLAVSSAAPAAERAAAFAAMDGLLLSGGTDLDPARYGAAVAGSTGVDPERDALEAEAWAAAETRSLPVLGICRGLQAMNAFAGGSLVQHVDGHAGPAWGSGPALTHPMRLVPGSRLARILSPSNLGAGVVTVNSYHHQGVVASGLAPGFTPAAFSASPSGELVEAFEAASGPFRAAVQCHPERTESTPAAFERLFAFFVDACRGPATSR